MSLLLSCIKTTVKCDETCNGNRVYSRFQVTFQNAVAKFVLNIPNYIAKFRILRGNLLSKFASC